MYTAGASFQFESNFCGWRSLRCTFYSFKNMSIIQISFAEKIRRATSLLTTSHLNSPTELKEAVHKLRQRPNFRIGHSHKGLPLWSRKMMFDPSRKSHGNQSSGLCILLGHSTPLGASERTRAHTHRTKRSFRVRLTSTVNW